MNQFQKWMVGRYGLDELNQALLVAGFTLSVISMFTNNRVVSYLSWILIIFLFYRTLSKNIWKRKQENQKFLKYIKPVQASFQKKAFQAKDQTSKYYKCPTCKQKIRVPRGKGKIEISCPKCRSKFIKKT